MANCLRFEIFIPLRYQRGDTIAEVNPADIERFYRKIAEKYHGYTRSDPYTPSNVLGYWKGESEEMTSGFVLVSKREKQRSG